MSDTIYIDAAEVAKMIRKDLAKAYPGHTFRVTTSKYSGGASIRVCYTDGPAYDDVKQMVGMYSGSGFDGSIDLKYDHKHWQMPDGSIVYGGTSGTGGSGGSHPDVQLDKPHPQAKRVSLMADFIFVERSCSYDLVCSVVKELGLDVAAVRGRDVGDGAYYRGEYNEEAWVSRKLSETSAYAAPAAKPQAPATSSSSGVTVEHDRDWTWVKFPGKPAQEVIDQLKAAGARWSSKRTAWYFNRPVQAQELGF